MDSEELFDFLTTCYVTAPFFRCVTTINQLLNSLKLFQKNSKNLFIVNTSSSSDVLGHWLVVFAAPGYVVVFDSFADNLDFRLLEFVSHLNGNLFISKKQLQQKSSCTCPAYCILFAVYLCLGYKLHDILNWFSGSDLALNDRSVFNWLQTRTTAFLSKNKLLKCIGLRNG